jgi:hypothetical protein
MGSVFHRLPLLAGLLALLSLLLTGGCSGPSAEDMQKQWHANEESVQKYSSKYPAFKTALDDLLAAAKKDFDAAKGADEKKRGSEMKAVNERVTSSTKAFADYEAELDKLNKLMKDKELNDLPASKFNPVNDAAKEAIKKAEGIMKDSKPANMGEAKAKIEEAIKALKDSSQALEALKPAKGTPAANTASPASTGASTGTAAATSSPTASPK